MYNIIKTVIESKRYELTDMLNKIDTMWVQDELTDAERLELIELARDNANPSDSYAPLREQVETLFEEMKTVKQEVAELKDKVTKLEGGTVEPPETEEYPNYVQPTGAHDAYHKDDKITFDSKKYICIAPDGVAVVWSPSEYPAYWQLVE